MRDGNGDLYFAAADLFGKPSPGWRIAGAGVAIFLYVITATWVSRALTILCPREDGARRTARIAWFAATLGAALAATLNVGHGWSGFRDAVFEIGAASAPLLITRRLIGGSSVAHSTPPIRRDWRVIGVSLGIYAVFVATLGRGLYS
jgi:hypothetical protein